MYEGIPKSLGKTFEQFQRMVGENFKQEPPLVLFSANRKLQVI